MAHLGVLAELESAGVVVDRVGGCSMGSMVGALYATGVDADEVHSTFREAFIGGDYYTNLFEDYSARVAALRARLYGERIIEELPRDFYSVSADLVGGGLVTHRDGLVADAVGASTALPGLVPPYVIGERVLVDGGVLDNLPVDAMANDGDGPIVAIDVAARRSRVARWASRLGDADEVSPADILMQAFDLGSVNTGAAAQRRADVFIAPEITAGMLQYHKMDQVVQAGREATRAALDDIRALVS
jgi:predicted acylesterase/phospholipase RssA